MCLFYKLFISLVFLVFCVQAISSAENSHNIVRNNSPFLQANEIQHNGQVFSLVRASSCKKYLDDTIDIYLGSQWSDCRIEDKGSKWNNGFGDPIIDTVSFPGLTHIIMHKWDQIKCRDAEFDATTDSISIVGQNPTGCDVLYSRCIEKDAIARGTFCMPLEVSFKEYMEFKKFKKSQIPSNDKCIPSFDFSFEEFMEWKNRNSLKIINL